MTNRETINALAEHVMGWRVHCRNTAHWVLASEQYTTYGRPQASVSDWNPLIDPAVSKQLRDKMRADGGYVRIEVTPSGKATCSIWGKFGKVFTERADTEEMAVALAMLKAVGVEVTSEERVNGRR